MAQSINNDTWNADAFREGSASMFKRIYHIYVGQLLHYAKKMVDNAEAAEDIVSDSFFKLWQVREQQKFTNPENIKAFLYIITRHACLNHLKSVRNRMPYQPLEDRLLTEDPEIWASMIKGDFFKFLYKAIEQLPSRQAEVFKLTYIDGLSTEEISTALGIAPSAVFANKSLALKKLRSLLKTSDWLLLLSILKIFN